MPYYSLKKRHALFLSVILLLVAIIVPAICLADAATIFKENNKAVVFIVVYDDAGKTISQGSGFIVRRDGVIVTNYHVISNASSIKIKAGADVLNVDGPVYLDEENDIAILKADAKNLPIVKLGNLAKTAIGEKVFVISSPKGLENTISDGILSGKREIASNKIIIQITAPISPGSSGGPVFNKNGEVIGIVTFLIKNAQNLNFAIPLDVIRNKITSNKLTVIKKNKIDDYEKTAQYWYYLGFTYSETGKNIDAVEAYKHAIRINPDFAKAYNDLGTTYHSLGRYEDAVQAFKQAIRINPDLDKPHYNLGNSYRELGLNKEAVEAFKQAIRINPDFADAYNNLGNVYGILGLHQEAIKAFMQAIRIKPGDPAAYYNLGNAYGLLGLHQEAIKAYIQTVRIDPNFAMAYNNLGASYVYLGLNNEAVEAFKQAIRINPDFAKAYFLLGVTYVLLKDTAAAIDQYKVLKKLDHSMADQLFNLIYK